jgi:hypothetical protein
LILRCEILRLTRQQQDWQITADSPTQIGNGKVDYTRSNKRQTGCARKHDWWLRVLKMKALTEKSHLLRQHCRTSSNSLPKFELLKFEFAHRSSTIQYPTISAFHLLSFWHSSFVMVLPIWLFESLPAGIC